MHIAIVFILFAGLMSGFYRPAPHAKNELNLAVGPDETLRSYHEVVPLTETLSKCMVKQHYDYSCGSAALGTLLNFYLGEQFTEKQIIHGLMKYGDKEQIKNLRAFSFWDMQKFVQALGYTSGGYGAELSDLKDPDLWPCIVPIEIFGYRHFVVFKGIHKGHVLVVDPWRGNGSYTVAQFTDMWYNNVLFLVQPRYGKTVSCLALKEEDMRFINQDMQRTLMFDVDIPFDLPGEWEADFVGGKVQRYKQ